MGKILLGLAVLAALGWGGWKYEHKRALEHRLSRVASALAGRPVRVHCESSAGAMIDVGAELGTVQFDAAGHPADTTELEHGVCVWLSSLQRRRAAEAALAVEVLTHESEHLAGYMDESVAQCRARQLMGWTARQLGATPAQARAWTAISVEHTPSMPPEYYDPTCPAFRAQTIIPSPQ